MKSIHALNGRWAERIFVAAQVLIQPVIGGYQSAFKGGDGPYDILEPNGICHARKCCPEIRQVSLDVLDDIHRHIAGHGHFNAGLNGTFRLFLQGRGTAIPKLFVEKKPRLEPWGHSVRWSGSRDQGMLGFDQSHQGIDYGRYDRR
jgi:hypothetical protein